MRNLDFPLGRRGSHHAGFNAYVRKKLGTRPGFSQTGWTYTEEMNGRERNSHDFSQLYVFVQRKRQISRGFRDPLAFEQNPSLTGLPSFVYDGGQI